MTEKPEMILSGDFVKDGFAIARYINSMGKELRGLGNAFFVCGNEKMSEQLHGMFEECNMLDDAIRNLVSNETSRGLHDAQQASANMLLACLADVKMKEANNPDVVIVS